MRRGLALPGLLDRDLRLRKALLLPERPGAPARTQHPGDLRAVLGYLFHKLGADALPPVIGVNAHRADIPVKSLVAERAGEAHHALAVPRPGRPVRIADHPPQP